MILNTKLRTFSLVGLDGAVVILALVLACYPQSKWTLQLRLSYKCSPNLLRCFASIFPVGEALIFELGININFIEMDFGAAVT